MQLKEKVNSVWKATKEDINRGKKTRDTTILQK